MKTNPDSQAPVNPKNNRDLRGPGMGRRLIIRTAGLAAAFVVASPAMGLTTATTTTHVTDMVQRVGGDDVTVLGLMSQGVDPHLYKPAASDVGSLRRADHIFYSGLMLEG